MGTGKSTIAKLLAASTGHVLVEMDAEIEKREGMSISDIFAKKGEAYFRDREREVVQELSAGEGLVISTGGGVVLNSDNIKDFKSTGVVVGLNASPETIYERVKHEKHRPLLKTADPFGKIKELLEARARFYAKADATVETDGKTLEAIATEVEMIVREKSGS